MEVSNLLLGLIPGEICRARVGPSGLQTRLVDIYLMNISNGVCHGIIYIMSNNR